MLNTAQLLQKAVLGVSDFGGAGGTNAGAAPNEAPLSVEQVTEFIELMSAGQVMLGEARTVMSAAQKWQESIVQFGGRIMKPGTEFTRLADGDRSAPLTGSVEISTVLLRGEIPVSDEVWEDQVAGPAFAASLERLISDRAGFDIEDLFVNADLLSGDPYLAQLDGWLMQSDNEVDCASYGKDFQSIFAALLQNMPVQYLRNGGAFYIPVRVEQQYREILAARGTALGDATLQGTVPLSYQGIPIKSAPTFDLGITAATPDAGKILLTNKDNLYAGYHRALKFESFRDPREGGMSFIVTARVDAKVAVPEATVVGTNVNCEIG